MQEPDQKSSLPTLTKKATVNKTTKLIKTSTEDEGYNPGTALAYLP